MASSTFKIAKITKGEYGFQVKFVSVDGESFKDDFGVKLVPRTYYRWYTILHPFVVEGIEVQLDPEKYRIEEEPFTPPDKPGETIMLKYLKERK